MMEAMTLGITLMAFDKMSRVISNACNQSNDEFSKLQSKIKNVSDTMEKVGKTAALVGGGMVASGVALGTALGLGDIIPQMLETEKKLIDIGNVGNLSTKQIAGLNNELSKISSYTNQTTPELLDAVNFYAAQGIVDTQKLAEMTKIAGRVATAEGANITEVATAAYRVTDNLKVPVKQLNKVMDILAQSGKEGSFELKNMAQYFPQLTASAMSLGMKGVPAVAQLGASLQIAMKGAGDAGIAANNFANFLQKIKMPDTFKDLEKFDLTAKQLQKMAKAGKEIPPQFKGISVAWEKALNAKDPVYEIINLLKKLQDQGVKTTAIFQDRQVLDFVNIMIPNLKMYEKIKAKTLSANGVINKDYDNVKNGTLAQIKAIQITMNNMAKANLLEPLKKVNEILNTINEHPILQKGLFNLMLGLTGGGLLLLTLGGASFAIGKMTEGYGKFLDISRKLTPVLKQNAIQLLKQSGLSRTADFIKNPSLNKGLAQANPYFKNQGYGSLLGNLNQDIFKNSKSAKTFDKIFNKETYTKMPSNLMGAFNKQLTSSERTLEIFKRNSNMNFIQISSNFKKFAGSFSVKSMFTGALSGIWSVIRTFGILNLTLLTSPIFWIGLAIGGAALLIYKYWKPITAFFKGVWQGIVIATKPLHPAFAKIGKALSPLINWFKGLIKPVDDVGGKSQALGLKVGKAIGDCINWVVKFGKQLWDLSKPFRELIGWIAKIALKLSPLYWLFKGGKWIFDMNTKDGKGNGKVTKHHTGLRLSPNEHWAVILRNEAVLNPKEAEIYRKNGLGKAVNLPSISHNFTAPRTKATLMKNMQSSQKPIVINNNPTINVAGGEKKEIEKQIKEALRKNQLELEKMLKKIAYEQGRRAFA